MDLPHSYNWVPVLGACLYGITTPIGIAVGLGIRSTYNPGSTTAAIVSGVLDSFSAGILIYTGLVEVIPYPRHPCIFLGADVFLSYWRTNSCLTKR